MGEEENELEGGVYGGENFLNHVRKNDFRLLRKYRFSSFEQITESKIQASLTLPPFSHPATNLGRVLVDDQVCNFAPPHSSSFYHLIILLQGKEVKMNFDHGTTTLGFKYQVGHEQRH